MLAPSPKKVPKSLVAHNHERIDNYFWMNDRENPEVIEHLKSENEYTNHILSSTDKMQKTIFEEIKGRIKKDDSSAPYFNNGYWYYSRYEKGKEYPIHCRKKEVLSNDEEILIDENIDAKLYPYYSVVSFSISKNNQILAFAEDLSGRRMYRIRFKNLNTGDIYPNEIINCGSDLAWHNDNNKLYHSFKDVDTLRPHIISCHDLNENSSMEIFKEEDDTFICGVSISKDFGHLFLGSYSTLTTEFKFKSADDYSPFEVFLERETGHEYYPEIINGEVFIKTNKEAENFKLVKTVLKQRSMDNWIEIQGYDKSIFLEDFEPFENHLVVQEKENGLSRIRVYDKSDYSSRLIPPFEETYTLYIGTNLNAKSNKLRIGYSSMTTPHSVFDISFDSFNKELVKQTEVLGEFNSEDYQSERIWASSEDGVKIPISLTYKKDLFKKDGTNPVLVYAYGSYGSTIDPYFSSARLTLLNRGFVFALAHIRGGEYLGRYWYESGKLLHKKNTFNDFIKCAEHLVEEKYASSNKVFAMGGSAGGLLMGAIANMKPELWKGIVSQVPFVDVVSTMMDDSIPLTTGEYDEWGNPNIKKYYDYILSYSPYDNIEKKSYPAILVTSGLHDSQVQYWEPTKYVAKLREYQTNKAPILLHTNMEAGHGGASGRFEALKEVALEYAFIFWLNETKID
jgi:oligopeptidase B